MKNVWLVMFLGGLATFLTRLSFILLVGRREIPDWLRRSLRFVPPAVLTAIIIPELLLPGGRLDISIGNERLLAGLLAVLVAWKTRNTILTILVGMIALWIFRLVL